MILLQEYLIIILDYKITSIILATFYKTSVKKMLYQDTESYPLNKEVQLCGIAY